MKKTLDTLDQLEAAVMRYQTILTSLKMHFPKQAEIKMADSIVLAAMTQLDQLHPLRTWTQELTPYQTARTIPARFLKQAEQWHIRSQLHAKELSALQKKVAAALAQFPPKKTSLVLPLQATIAALGDALDEPLHQHFDQCQQALKKLTQDLMHAPTEEINARYQIILTNILTTVQKQLQSTKKLLASKKEYFAEDKVCAMIDLSYRAEAYVSVLENIEEQLQCNMQELLHSKIDQISDLTAAWQNSVDEHAKQIREYIDALSREEKVINSMEQELQKHGVKQIFHTYQKRRENIDTLSKKLTRYHGKLKKLNDVMDEVFAKIVTEKSKQKFEPEQQKTLQLCLEKLAKRFQKTLCVTKELEEPLKKYGADCNPAPKNTVLHENMANTFRAQQMVFSTCYTFLASETNASCAKLQRKILLVNMLTNKNKDSLTKLAIIFKQNNLDASGIEQFQYFFVTLLFLNTIHSNDFNYLMSHYKKWLKNLLNHAELQDAEQQKANKLIENCLHRFEGIQKYMAEWKVSLASHVASLGMGILEPLLTWTCSTFLPSNLSIMSDQSSVFTDVYSHARPGVPTGISQTLSKASDALSPEDCKSPTFEEGPRTDLTLPGVPAAGLELTPGAAKLFLKTRDWENNYKDAIKNQFNMQLGITLIGASITFALTITGATTPLASLLMSAGTSINAFLMKAYDAYKKHSADQENQLFIRTIVEQIDALMSTLYSPARRVSISESEFKLTLFQTRRKFSESTSAPTSRRPSFSQNDT